MVIHGGGVYGDLSKQLKDLLCENYNNLPNHIKNRLVLEKKIVNVLIQLKIVYI